MRVAQDEAQTVDALGLVQRRAEGGREGLLHRLPLRDVAKPHDRIRDRVAYAGELQVADRAGVVDDIGAEVQARLVAVAIGVRIDRVPAPHGHCLSDEVA